MRRTYRQNKDTGKFEEVRRTQNHKLSSVTDDITPYVSPVDGSVISNKRQLESHNKRNGVTNDLDSLREKTKRYKQGQSADFGKKERISSLIRSYDYVQQNSRS